MMVTKNYGYGELQDLSDPGALHEAKLLMLDITKAKVKLCWEPRMDISQCIELVVDWYKKYNISDNIYELCIEEIKKYLSYSK